MNEALRDQLEGSIALLDGRLCKDCRHYKAGASAYTDVCQRKRKTEDGVALVRGTETHDITCAIQRMGSPTENICGAAGRFFEQKVAR